MYIQKQIFQDLSPVELPQSTGMPDKRFISKTQRMFNTTVYCLNLGVGVPSEFFYISHLFSKMV